MSLRPPFAKAKKTHTHERTVSAARKVLRSCPRATSKTAQRAATEPYLHPFPKALVVRQSFPKALKKAWLVGKGNKLLDKIALSQKDVKNDLVRINTGQR